MQSPLLFIVYIRFSTLWPVGQIWSAKPFHLAAKQILPIMKKYYICEKCVDLVECNICRKNHITQDVWPSNCCAIAYVVLSQKNLKNPGLYEFHRQSQTRRQACHCLELQDKLFAICGRIGTACMDILSRVFSLRLIAFLLRAVMCPSHFCRVRVTTPSSQSHLNFSSRVRDESRELSSHFESLVCKLESMSS